MPITNGKYVAPKWVNGTAPPLNAGEMNDIGRSAESILFPELNVYFADSGTIVTASNGAETVTLVEENSVWTGEIGAYGTWTVTGQTGGETLSVTVDVEEVKKYTVVLVPSVQNASWSLISNVAQEGVAGSAWDIGDTKSVSVNGTIGTLSLNATLYVYIIGINHQGVNGITWQGFKTSPTSRIISLVDSHYGSGSTDGSLWFNINHWGSSTYGGWKGCDLRYDILGSTDVAPSGYGAIPTSSRVGYDASPATATNPVPNTLMAALPVSLRSVMRPMTIFTNNYTGGSNPEYVSSSMDYLPLLAAYEVFGWSIRNISQYTSMNIHEIYYQEQYEFYKNGPASVVLSHIRYPGSGLCNWTLRSPLRTSPASFFSVYSSAGNTSSITYSYGLSPIFLV